MGPPVFPDVRRTCFILLVHNGEERRMETELYSCSPGLLDLQVRYQLEHTNPVERAGTPPISVQGVWDSVEAASEAATRAGPAVFALQPEVAAKGLVEEIAPETPEEFSRIREIMSVCERAKQLPAPRYIEPLHHESLFYRMPYNTILPLWLHRIQIIQEGRHSGFIPAFPNPNNIHILRAVCVKKWGEICASMTRLHIIFSDDGECTWNENLVNLPDAAAAQAM